MTPKTQREITLVKRKNEIMLQNILNAGKKAKYRLLNGNNNFTGCISDKKNTDLIEYYKSKVLLLNK